MLTALRRQVQEVLYACTAVRKPALRRSDDPRALLATDLPLAAGPQQAALFCARMESLGWTTCQQNGWILLDVPVPAPQTAVPGELKGECGCCISLLLRHPEDAPAQEQIRAVVKAADAGRQPFERLCSSLHADFAARLRRHQPLPGALLPYLCDASQRFD